MNFLKLNYWFNTRPEPFAGLTQISLMILLIIFIIMTIISKILANKKKLVIHRFWQKLFNFCLFNSLVGLLLLFFNYELIPILMSKFWYPLWLITDLIWLFFIIKFIILMPKRKVELEKQKEFSKYIPG